jgi:hypothetical protein
MMDWIKRAAGLCAAAAVAVTLAGCMITSEAELVSDADGNQILPADIYLFGYEEDKAAPDSGAYTKGTDAPLHLVLKGNTYVSDDNSTSIRFVTLDAPDTHLLAMVSSDGSVYGTAVIRDSLLLANVVLTDSDPAVIIDAEKAGNPALANVTVEDGGLVLKTRAELDAVIQLAMDGKLELGGLVMFIGETADAPAPARLVPDGDFYKAG